MKPSLPAWRRITSWLVAGLQVLLFVSPALTARPVHAQESGTSSVDRGREYYEQSRFDEAIALLQDLVDRGALSGDDMLKARELLARSLVKKGYPARGREMFKQILLQDPQWRPDPIRVPPDETAVFEQALQEYQAEQKAATPPDTTSTPRTPAGTPPAETGTQPQPPPAPTPTRPVAATTIVPKEKKSNKTWLWIGGGVLAAGVIAAVAAGGGKSGNGGDNGGTSTLPGFPDHP